MDFVAHVRQESELFLAALKSGAPDTPVPTCPGWDASDLLWHLGEVQWFWGKVVNDQITDGAVADALQVSRPDGWVALVDFFESSSSALVTGLETNSAETTVWTWAVEQSVGFVRRRQAQEALIHRVDAEVTAGRRSPMDAALSSDGVDELLRIMYGGVPPWGSFTTTEGHRIHVRTTDTDASWLVELGWFKGTDPDSGKTYDEADIRAKPTAPDVEAAATISGTAADLDCWLWHRPELGEISQSGDGTVLGAFEAFIAPGID